MTALSIAAATVGLVLSTLWVVVVDQFVDDSPIVQALLTASGIAAIVVVVALVSVMMRGWP